MGGRHLVQVDRIGDRAPLLIARRSSARPEPGAEPAAHHILRSSANQCRDGHRGELELRSPTPRTAVHRGAGGVTEVRAAPEADTAQRVDAGASPASCPAQAEQEQPSSRWEANR